MASWGQSGQIPEDEYEILENPQDVWNEERIQLDTRYLKANKDTWRDGKDIHQQLESIINNRQMQFRMLDCCANCPICCSVCFFPCYWGCCFWPFAHILWVPWTAGFGCCALYGATESNAGMNNGIIAAVKCAVCCPFFGWWWVPPATKTVLREAQEVPGHNLLDAMGMFCCCCCQSCNMFYNAYYMDKSWLPEEFTSRDPIELQKCHDGHEEKVHLD